MNAQQTELWEETAGDPLTDAEAFFAWGKEHGFPRFDFSLGRGWDGIIQPGEVSYRGFCEKADVYAVRVAAQKALQHKEEA